MYENYITFKNEKILSKNITENMGLDDGEDNEAYINKLDLYLAK